MSEVIELTLPAEPDLLVLVRFAAAAVAERADFSVDEIGDLRLAVDELCLSLLKGRTMGRLELRFERGDDSLSVACRFDPSGAGDGGVGRREIDGALEPDPRRPRGRARTRERGWARAGVVHEATDQPPGPDGSPPRRDVGVRGVRTDTRDPELRNQLVESHLGLASQLARRFAYRGQSLDDLTQVAAIGLVNSVDRFDPGRGVEFSTFATRTIIGELKRHFRDKGWAIRAPRRIQELYLELGQAIESLTHELGRSPTVAELAAEVGSTEDAVLEAMWPGELPRRLHRCARSSGQHHRQPPRPGRPRLLRRRRPPAARPEPGRAPAEGAHDPAPPLRRGPDADRRSPTGGDQPDARSRLLASSLALLRSSFVTERSSPQKGAHGHCG